MAENATKGAETQYRIFFGGDSIQARPVGPEISGFSSEVVPTSLEALRRSEIETTGGTDLDCVARRPGTNAPYLHRDRWFCGV